MFPEQTVDINTDVGTNMNADIDTDVNWDVTDVAAEQPTDTDVADVNSDVN